MKIAIFGAGYVGLVTSTCFAEMGNTATCIDNNKQKIDSLNNCEIPIFEPGLSELVKSNLNKRLFFKSNPESVLKDCDIIFLAVGTPENTDGSPVLDNLFDVANSIGRFLDKDCIVVQKSTAPIGTCDKIISIINKELIARKSNYNVSIVSNPEFLKEGNAVSDFMSPDRIVIGSDNKNSLKVIKELYKPFILNHDRFIDMDIRSAEMTKYASNAILAAKISFINEIANICKGLGADVNQVRVGIGSDKRIGYDFIYPGIGFGGSCFPKDLKALEKMAEDADYKSDMIRSISSINLYQKVKFSDDIVDRFLNDKMKSLNGIKIAVWGLTFKPKTDDLRNAPSIYIINRLIEKGATVYATDPKASKSKLSSIFKSDKLIFSSNQYDILKEASCLLLLTEWLEFRSPDFSKIKSLMKNPIIFDGRNQYNRKELEALGFELHQI